MKDFTRADLHFSLCGLNCGLCPMHLNHYCPGCGGGEGNQSCQIAKCSQEHGKIEYCNQCQKYPCEHYEKEDEFDSFISRRNRIKDLEKMKRIGKEAYQAEQKEKVEVLNYLLENYNDVRKKTLFCLAVNLLELSDIKAAICQVEAEGVLELPLKERAASIAIRLQELAGQKQIILKLRKKVKPRRK